MLEKEVYQKIESFVFEALALGEGDLTLPRNKIIAANQSHPRPLKPFVIVQLMSFRTNGSPIKKTMLNGAEEDIQESILSRLCTASIGFFSDKLQQAEDMANHVFRYLDTELTNDVFNGEIALRKVLKTVTAIPKDINKQIESQAFFDIELGYLTSVKYSTGWIETVEITNKINDQTYIIKRE